MTAGKHDGMAMASACGACAWLIGNPDACAPGRHMAIVHDSHIPELVLLGWIVTYPDGPDDPPDVACEHYHAKYWQDG